LLSDPCFAGADTLATSHVLAKAISKLEPFPDLILCGVQTVDSDTGHVGPQIAEELDIPQVCYVNEIHPEGESLTVKRLTDDFLDTIRVSLPALLTVTHGLSAVSHLPLGALQVAFSDRKIKRWGIRDLELKSEEVGFEGSATHVSHLRTPEPKSKGALLEGSPQTLVSAFIRKLEAMSLLEEDHENE
jgi:electron transfer flavoprotein beta subunit